MLLNEILLEYSIINPEAMTEFLEPFADQLKSPIAQKWLLGKKVKKWLTDNEQTSNELERLPDDAPDWTAAALERGEILYSFEPTLELKEDVEHLVDYLNWVHDTATTDIPKDVDQYNQRKQLKFEAEKTLKGFDQNRYSFEQAIELGDTWLEDITNPESDISKIIATPAIKPEDTKTADEPGTVIAVDLSDGFVIRELQSAESLTREGNLMKHCIGAYSTDVKAGKKKIYSLRDSANEPHITFEVSDGGVGQAKGKNNRPPTQKYVPYFLTALQKLKVPPNTRHDESSDLSRMGILWSAEEQRYGSWTELAKEKWKKDQYTAYGFDRTQKLFHKSIGSIISVNRNSVEDINDDLNLSERSSASPYVAEFLNTTYGDMSAQLAKKEANQAAIRFFGLYFEESDNTFKLITPSAMTQVFQDGEYEYYRRGDVYYLKVKDKFMQILEGEPHQNSDGDFIIIPTLSSNLFNYRATIERFLNHRGKFGGKKEDNRPAWQRRNEDKFEEHLLQKLGLLYYNNRFQTPEEAGMIVYTDSKTNIEIVKLNEHIYVIEDSEPIILLKIYGSVLDVKKVVAERFDGLIPGRVSSVLIDFLKDSEIKYQTGESLRKDGGIYHQDGKYGDADAFRTSEKTGKFEILSNPNAEYPDHTYVIVIDGEKYGGFNIRRSNNSIDFNYNAYENFIQLISPYDQQVVDLLNEKNFKVQYNNDHKTLVRWGLDYDFVAEKFTLRDDTVYSGRIIHQTPEYYAILKHSKSNMDKSSLALRVTGEKKATVRIEVDNEFFTPNAENTYNIRKIHYVKGDDFREVSVSFVVDFVNAKAQDLNMGSKMGQDMWAALDIQKNSDGTLTSLLGGTEEEQKKRKIVAGDYKFDSGYMLSKSRGGGKVKYLLTGPSATGDAFNRVSVELRMEKNGLPTRIDWYKLDDSDVPQVRAHIIEILSAFN